MVARMSVSRRRLALGGLFAVIASVALCAGLLVSMGSASETQRIGPTVNLKDDLPYSGSYLHGFWVDGHTADYQWVHRHHLYHGGSTDFEGKQLIDFTLEEETNNRDFMRMWSVSFFGSTPHYDLTTRQIVHDTVPHGVRVRSRCWHRDRGSYDC